MEVRKIPPAEKRLSLLFKKFSTLRQKVKEFKLSLKRKSINSDKELLIEELEQDSKTLQKLKNQYSFGETSKASALADLFAKALEEFEEKINGLKS